MATETAVDVVMPQMGVSVSEGTITKWLKQEGEHVEADEPLLEISTDKVDTEVPSPASGTLTQILVQEGQTVDVGTKVGQIGGAAAPSGDGAAPQETPQQQETPPEPATQRAADESMAAASEGVGDVAPVAQPQTAPPATTNGKSFVSPVVARIASEHGVDPNQVEGTGRGGRVTKKDILNFIESGAQAKVEAPAEAEAPPAPEAPAEPAAVAAPAPEAPVAPEQAPAPPPAPPSGAI
jgi:2-oxoglutarate dehydrogenase E2 component (dihydrolipoamide succinyltransferase)